MKIIDVIQKSPEWLEWRKGGISASEIAVIIGESPYMTPWWLWAVMVGKIDRVDLSRNPIVLEGVRNEPRIRQHIEEQYNTLLLPICAECDSNPLFRASLDGFSDNGEPWELKWPTEKSWLEVILLGEKSKAFKLYEPQVQQQMLVTDSSKGYLVFGHDGENGIEVKIFEIARCEKRIGLILEEGKKFWDLYQTRTAPTKDEALDFFEPEGSDREKWKVLAERARSIDVELTPLEKEVARLKGVKDEIKSEAAETMGNFRRGSHSGLNVTRVFRQGNIDYDKVIEQLGGMDELQLDSYRKEGSFSTRLSVSAKSTNSIQPIEDAPPVLIELSNTDLGSDYF